jgi:hypothetical protein
MVPAVPRESTDGPTRREGVVVRIWESSVLDGPRPDRGTALRPVLGERVPPNGRLVVGRRQSDRHPRRESGDGVVRVALDQDERPRTSRRHLELDLTEERPLVRVLASVKSPARSRPWGTLLWDEEPPGAQRLLPPGRPLAMLLPGTPGYVVSFEYADTDPDAGAEAQEDPRPEDDEPFDVEDPLDDGETESGTEVAADGPRLLLRRSEIETLARIFWPALQWPPRPDDDTTPPWTSLPHEEALRAAYRRIEQAARKVLGFRRGRAPDPALLARLVSSGCLTYEHVARVAEACDLPLHPRRLV